VPPARIVSLPQLIVIIFLLWLFPRMSAAAGGANVMGHLPTWSKAEGHSGLVVNCTRLLK